eukprot:TRINITY_DN2779_c0_g1_i1.p1 TRINITY_DN2779_c0_g1~~TRINITY_DN2779_c0_g1_i1.p1  ORF type:complete len:240 (+),score=65.45 TRINITY_DN2779_c0_g1_i1:75-794(+)
MMNKIILSLAMLIAVTLASNCGSIKAADGTKYNIASLEGTVYTASQLPDGPSKYDYSFAVCDLLSKPCGVMEEASLCQEWNDGAASLGKYTSTGTGQNGGVGVLISYTDGEPFSPSRGQPKVPRTATLNITCDKSVKTIQLVSVVHDADTAEYKAVALSAHACPGGGGSSGGSGGAIFLIILLVVAIVYFAGGIAYNKIKQNDELLPQQTFWVGLPGLVVDGGKFIGSKTCCRGQVSFE